MITFGNTSIEISLISVFLAVLAIKILPIIAWIWFVVKGFRVHWGWGVANLLIPGAIIPFCIFHPKESKGPLILIGICLGVFLILWLCARHESSSRPRVQVAPGLSASATNAVLHLKLVSFNEASRTGSTISCILSRKNLVMFADPSNGRYDEERLIAIQTDGFVLRFTDRVGGEMRTNFVLFPYGQTTETNTLGWSVVGDYNGKATSFSNTAPEPSANDAFRLLATNGFTAPSVGGGSAFVRLPRRADTAFTTNKSHTD
jgi:hypothetical protein